MLKYWTVPINHCYTTNRSESIMNNSVFIVIVTFFPFVVSFMLTSISLRSLFSVFYHLSVGGHNPL